MFLSREDLQKIESYLKLNSKKDSEFEVAETVNGEETIVIVQDNKNKRINLKEVIDLLSPYCLINVSDIYLAYGITLSEARSLVPVQQRVPGVLITFLNADLVWEIFLFIGVEGSWMFDDAWKGLFDWESFTVNSILPDNEDLTTTPADEQGNVKLKLADKPFNLEEFSGLGSIILRKNIIEIVNSETTGDNNLINLLSLDSINKENTIYHIKYDFNLNGQTLVIPNNCTLKFDGGSIINGTITGSDTIIDATPYNIFKNIAITGSWQLTNIYPQWFGAKGDGNTDCTDAIQKCVDYFFKGTITFIKGIYNISKGITVNWKNVCFDLDKYAEIKATLEMDYMLFYNTAAGGTSWLTNKTALNYIKGGIWNGNYLANRIIINGEGFTHTYRDIHFRNTNNICFQSYPDSGSYAVHMFMYNCYFDNTAAKKDTIAIYNNNTDNVYTDVRGVDYSIFIQDTAYCLVVRASSWILTPELYDNSMFIKLSGGTNSIYKDCTWDTYNYGIYAAYNWYYVQTKIYGMIHIHNGSVPPAGANKPCFIYSWYLQQHPNDSVLFNGIIKGCLLDTYCDATNIKHFNYKDIEITSLSLLEDFLDPIKSSLKVIEDITPLNYIRSIYDYIPKAISILPTSDWKLSWVRESFTYKGKLVDFVHCLDFPRELLRFEKFSNPNIYIEYTVGSANKLSLSPIISKCIIKASDTYRIVTVTSTDLINWEVNGIMNPDLKNAEDNSLDFNDLNFDGTISLSKIKNPPAIPAALPNEAEFSVKYLGDGLVEKRIIQTSTDNVRHSKDVFVYRIKIGVDSNYSWKDTWIYEGWHLESTNAAKSGPTNSRPLFGVKSNNSVYNGFCYFDTDLNKPVYWSNGSWVEMQ